jgi:hypothetical protein
LTASTISFNILNCILMVSPPRLFPAYPYYTTSETRKSSPLRVNPKSGKSAGVSRVSRSKEFSAVQELMRLSELTKGYTTALEVRLT